VFVIAFLMAISMPLYNRIGLTDLADFYAELSNDNIEIKDA